jgi:hypothetical protein
MLSSKNILVSVAKLKKIFEEKSETIKSLQSGLYAGFDERDIKDYNLSEEEYIIYKSHKEQKNNLEQEMTTIEIRLRTYLLLFFQIYSEKLTVLTNSLTDEDAGDKKRMVFIRFLIDQLLVSSQIRSDSVYMQSIKSLAALNQQLPLQPNKSTLLVEQCVELSASRYPGLAEVNYIIFFSVFFFLNSIYV